MITLELLQEFSEHSLVPNDIKRKVTSYKLYNTADYNFPVDGFTFIHIIFESTWESVKLDVYYEWLNKRRDSKLRSIGI